MIDWNKFYRREEPRASERREKRRFSVLAILQGAFRFASLEKIR